MTSCGRICLAGRKINLSQVFAGQNVGIKEVAEKIWLVTFMHYDLGFFDQEAIRVECAQNPFQAQVLPMSPEQSVTYVVGIDQKGNGAPERIRTSDPCLRRAVLYPAELRARAGGVSPDPRSECEGLSRLFRARIIARRAAGPKTACRRHH